MSGASSARTTTLRRSGDLGIHLGDGHALEEAEGAQPALALEHAVEAQRLAFLQRQLAPHHRFPGALEAGDHDVVHGGGRTRHHAEDDARLPRDPRRT